MGSVKLIFLKYRYQLILGALLLLTLWLLFFRVNFRTFWMDETQVLEYVSKSPGDFLIQYYERPENHPPLYYFLVLLVSKVLPGTELAIRLVSILSGFGIVILTYVFSLRVTGQKKVAWLATFFTFFSSYFVLISQMARYHSLAAFLGLLVLFYFFQLINGNYSRKNRLLYLIFLVATGYVDYVHFIYVLLITNLAYLFFLWRRKAPIPFLRWFGGQVAVGIFCLPLAAMIYNRIVFQGDGGFNKLNLLGNSWVNFVGGILMHIYASIFGENFLPWNFIVLALGVMVLVGVGVGMVKAIKNKSLNREESYVVGLGLLLIVGNTLFMNVADPRYNFIVYPKYGFLAHPFLIMSAVICLYQLRSKVVTTTLLFFWVVVALAGLVHFYGANNYLNASYFRDFKSFEFVRVNSTPGEYLAISGDASEGVYNFYRTKYFGNLRPLSINDVPTVGKNSEVWLFSTAADSNEESAGTASRIPDGFKILKSYDSVPLDPTLKKLKEKILHRPSYTYKYSIFLLKKL